MTRGANPDWCAWAESEAVGFSRISLFSRGAGESGRMRENQNAILPQATDCSDSDLPQFRENRENSSQLYTCAGAAHGNTICSRAGAPPDSPHPPSVALWAALVNKEDIYAIAYRLGLPPADTVDAWRLATLRVGKSEDFMRAKPSEVPLGRDEWNRWKAIEASPRKLLGLLRKLIYGVRIWD